ncbi:MAG: hypothetical protein J6B73_04345 [Methanobrevibacter sp.]|uniref:hypothetical protein n=1 Tax=Methanobrevibacter sp. TaxID=66852 RepID=UPI001B1A8B88|nr:hypothetical protein [Methanobrevibacter sp.]MBO5151379.1 hypothetical protein [Methanobrevibacter sp.]
MFLTSTNAKEPTDIKITSNNEQNEGGELSAILTDLNGTLLSNESVNITITNSEGKAVIENVVKTDLNGEAKLNLNLEKGEYNVNITYSGNAKYAQNNTNQKLTIKEAVTNTVSSTSSSQSSSTPYDINNLPPTNDPYPETKRYYTDQYHVRQEYADGYMRSVDIRTGQVYSHGFK